jgi:hypothetical protein
MAVLVPRMAAPSAGGAIEDVAQCLHDGVIRHDLSWMVGTSVVGFPVVGFFVVGGAARPHRPATDVTRRPDHHNRRRTTTPGAIRRRGTRHEKLAG